MKKSLVICSALLTLFLHLVFFAPVSEAAIRHKVNKGESLYSIAKKYHVSIEDLKDANTASAKSIKPGDRLIIPAQKKEASGKKIKSADPEKDIASKKKASKETVAPEIIAGPGKASPADLYHLVKKGDTLSSISRKYSVSRRKSAGLSSTASMRNASIRHFVLGGSFTMVSQKSWMDFTTLANWLRSNGFLM